jgi:DNA-binding NarL/FixJ family response regulator
MHEQTVIHVAADDSALRAKLARIVSDYGVVDVVHASREGAVGVAALKGEHPAVIVLAAGPTENVTEHAFWYRRAAPGSCLIGFAFTEPQAEAYENTVVDLVARSDMGRAAFLDLLQKAVDGQALMSCAAD